MAGDQGPRSRRRHPSSPATISPARGILLAGGGHACCAGLPELVASETGMPVYRADSPPHLRGGRVRPRPPRPLRPAQHEGAANRRLAMTPDSRDRLEAGATTSSRTHAPSSAGVARGLELDELSIAVGHGRPPWSDCSPPSVDLVSARRRAARRRRTSTAAWSATPSRRNLPPQLPERPALPWTVPLIAPVARRDPLYVVGPCRPWRPSASPAEKRGIGPLGGFDVLLSCHQTTPVSSFTARA